jgi:hypothetical protein
MNLEILTLIGLIGAIPAIPIFVGHLKAAARWRPRSRKGSLWPLVTDLVAIGWVAFLRDEGLLMHEVGAPDGVSLGLRSVVLLGIVLGAICTVGYDQYVARRPARPRDTTEQLAAISSR